VSAAKPPWKDRIRRWRVNGQGLVEYAMIIALVVIVAIVMVTLLGDIVANGMYSRIQSGLPNP
jgi:Flp pilus assembly pilin Flp